MTGGGPSSAASVLPRSGTADGRHRASAHPASPAARTTTGNGTANSASARNEATAMVTRAGLVRARLPTRMTAWTTIARTAGAGPPDSGLIAPGGAQGTQNARKDHRGTTP